MYLQFYRQILFLHKHGHEKNIIASTDSNKICRITKSSRFTVQLTLLKTLISQSILLYQRIYRISSVIRRSFSFQNNPKDLDLSCKMDLDLWDCLGSVKLVLLQNFIGQIKLFEVILEGQKPVL